MNKAGLLDLIAASELPAALKTYLDGVMGGGLPSSLRGPLKKDPAGFMAGVNALLAGAGAALGCAGEKALFLSGFDVGNKAPDRLEAALGELQAVVFLRSEGFSGLGFIDRGRAKTADISAARGGVSYAFEVCSARTAPELLSVDFLELKYDKKIRQARVSGRRAGLARAGFVLVAGEPAFSAIVPDARLAGLARGLYERKKKPAATHICLLAGGGSAVFPPWN